MAGDTDFAGGEDTPDERPPHAVTQEMIGQTSKESKRYWVIGLIMGALLGIITNTMVSAMFGRPLSNPWWYIIIFIASVISLIVVIYAMYTYLIKK